MITIIDKRMSSNGIINEYLFVIDVNRGKFAQVRRCVHKETNNSYAAKTIKKRRRAKDVSHEIMHEIRVLLNSNQSERIVKLYEVYETPTEFVLMLEM